MAWMRRDVGGVVLRWTVANFLGVGAIGALSLVPFLTSIRGILVSSLLIGLPLGFAQWMVLRRAARISILWVFSVSAGLILGLVVGPMLGGIWGFLDDESVLSLTAACTTIGLLVGMAQWLLLRARFDKPLVWPLSSAVGLGLGIAVVLATNLVDQAGIASIILVTFVYAVATGSVLAWLVAWHRRTESDSVSAI